MEAAMEEGEPWSWTAPEVLPPAAAWTESARMADEHARDSTVHWLAAAWLWARAARAWGAIGEDGSAITCIARLEGLLGGAPSDPNAWWVLLVRGWVAREVAMLEFARGALNRAWVHFHGARVQLQDAETLAYTAQCALRLRGSGPQGEAERDSWLSAAETHARQALNCDPQLDAAWCVENRYFLCG